MKIETGRRAGYTIVYYYHKKKKKVAKKKGCIFYLLKKNQISFSFGFIGVYNTERERDVRDNKRPVRLAILVTILFVRYERDEEKKKKQTTRGHELSLSAVCIIPAPKILGLGTSSLKVFFFFLPFLSSFFCIKATTGRARLFFPLRSSGARALE